MSNIPTILADLETYLIGLALSDVTFARNYLPKSELEELSPTTLKAIIFPNAETNTQETKNQLNVIRLVSIVFTGKIASGSLATGLDAFINKVQEVKEKIFDTMRGGGLLSGGVQILALGINPIYDYEKFANNSEFQSILTLTTKGSYAIS